VRILCLIAVLAACLLAGCASEPPRVPETLTRTHAAVLRAWSPAEGAIRVEAVDGVEIASGATHILVSPGEHQVRVRWSGAQSNTRVGQVRAMFQSGSTYVVEAEPDGALRTVRFSLVDKGPQYDEECLKPPFFGGAPKGRGC
jgi:hypothetical protein